MFDSSFTHVGIHCGCNKNSANVHMCCFQFGKDVTDKPTTKLINMIDIPRVNCEQSYQGTPDQKGVQTSSMPMKISEKPVEVKAAPKAKGTYKEIS